MSLLPSLGGVLIYHYTYGSSKVPSAVKVRIPDKLPDRTCPCHDIECVVVLALPVHLCLGIKEGGLAHTVGAESTLRHGLAWGK